eukprot:sb/3476078/
MLLRGSIAPGRLSDPNLLTKLTRLIALCSNIMLNFPAQWSREERKLWLHKLCQQAVHEIPMIYISQKQYRTNPCVLVTLNCASHSHIARHTFPENVLLTCLMKEQVITVCAAVPLPLAIV